MLDRIHFAPSGTSPAFDGEMWMVTRLIPEVCPDVAELLRIDRVDRVTLGPSQSGMSFGRRDAEDRTSSFHPLEKPRDRRGRMESCQEMDMIAHHPDFEYMGSFLGSHASQELRKKARESKVDQWCPIASGPREMDVEPMEHD